MQGEVLIAIMNSQVDFRILCEQSWYRIPISSVEKQLRRRWPPQWIAFYQTKVFKDEAYSVRYYAEVCNIREAHRHDLFPDEPPGPKQNKTYYQLLLKPLQTLPQPIFSRRWRRFVFISSTWEKFNSAMELNDLFDDSPLEDRLWAEFKRLQIYADRQVWVTVNNNHYFLDFAVYCMSGKLDVETDGDTWHVTGSTGFCGSINASEQDENIFEFSAIFMYIATINENNLVLEGGAIWKNSWLSANVSVWPFPVKNTTSSA